MLLSHAARLIPACLLVHAAHSQLLDSPPPTSDNSPLLIATALVLLALTAFICYDKRQGFRWVNAARHAVGELIRRGKQYRKKNGDKSLRIETEEILPTPKTTHITEADN
jgi:hypothetical protein